MSISVSIEKIKPSPYQPRIDFDLEELRGSILKYGIQDSLKVRKIGDHYELVDGERRLRIAKEESFKTVPCIITSYSDDEADAINWRLNVKRKDYSLEEKAKHFHKHQLEGQSASTISSNHDCSQPLVSLYLAIFRLPEQYQDYVLSGNFGYGHIAYLYSKGLLNGNLVNRLSDVLKLIDEAIERNSILKVFEAAVDHYLKILSSKEVEGARKAAATIEATEIQKAGLISVTPTPEVKPPETPDELESAAKVLKQEAIRRKTPEQIAKEAEDKKRKIEERQRKAEEKKKQAEERRRQEEKQRQEQIAIEAEKKAKEIKVAEVKAELLKDPEFQREVLKEIKESAPEPISCPLPPPGIFDENGEIIPSDDPSIVPISPFVKQTLTVTCPKCGLIFEY